MENGDLMEANRMKTLHPAYRVTDLDISLGFYTALGYQMLGRVDLGDGATLTVLKFPDEPVGTLELVHRPADGAVQLGTGFSHLAIQVDDLAGARQTLIAAGLAPAPQQRPGGPDGPRTSWLTDPDGYRIELVQWPPGHADGLSAADFA
jgi:lactoylglutathione lyase